MTEKKKTETKKEDAKPKKDEKKKPVKLSGIRVVSKITKLLAVKLTTDELLETARQLGKANQAIKTEDDKQTALKAEMKTRTVQFEATITELSSKITQEEELRDVEVEHVLDFKADLFIERRLDTREIIHSREILEHERQETLDMSDDKKKAKKK